ncbi:MAG: hypothetical protein E6Q27_04520 [Aeromicrobium sp.]|nr:MAG: hypothetical protein E6Q27_04520 [Aeromicrobium sp.]
MSKRRQRIAATMIALASTFALSACGTNFNAQTNNSYQASVGTNVRDGAIQVFNALFVANDNGTATFSGALLAPGEDQEIVSATVDGKEVELAAPIELKADTLLTVGAFGEIIVELDPKEVGGNVDLVLTAASGEKLKVSAIVVARTDRYKNVAEAAPGAPAAPESSTADESPAPEETEATEAAH